MANGTIARISNSVGSFLGFDPAEARAVVDAARRGLADANPVKSTDVVDALVEFDQAMKTFDTWPCAALLTELGDKVESARELIKELNDHGSEIASDLLNKADREIRRLNEGLSLVGGGGSVSPETWDKAVVMAKEIRAGLRDRDSALRELGDKKEMNRGLEKALGDFLAAYAGGRAGMAELRRLKSVADKRYERTAEAGAIHSIDARRRSNNAGNDVIGALENLLPKLEQALARGMASGVETVKAGVSHEDIRVFVREAVVEAMAAASEQQLKRPSKDGE